jgi:hypothetical protein
MKIRIILLFLICAMSLSYSDQQSTVDKWDDLLMDFAWIYPFSTTETFQEQPFYYSYVSNNFLMQTNVIESFKFFEKEKKGHVRYWDKFSLQYYLNAIVQVLNKAGRNNNVFSGAKYVNSKITSGSRFYPDPETLFDDAESFFLFRDVPATARWQFSSFSIETNMPIVYLKLCSLPNPVIYWQEGFRTGNVYTHFLNNFANFAGNKAFSVVSTNDDYQLFFDVTRTNNSDQIGMLDIEFYDKVDMAINYSCPYVTNFWDVLKIPYDVTTNAQEFFIFGFSGLYGFDSAGERTNISYTVENGNEIAGNSILHFEDVEFSSENIDGFKIAYKSADDKVLCLNLSQSGVSFDNSANILDESLLYSLLSDLADNLKTSLAYYKVPAAAEPLSKTAMFPHYYHKIEPLTAKNYYGEGTGASVEEAFDAAFSIASTNVTYSKNHQSSVEMDYLVKLNPFGEEKYAEISCTVTENMIVELNCWYPYSYTNMLGDYAYDVDVFYHNVNSSISGDHLDPSGIWYNRLNNYVYELNTTIRNIDAGSWTGSVYTNTLDTTLNIPAWIDEYLSITNDDSYIRMKSEMRSIGCYFERKEKNE